MLVLDTDHMSEFQRGISEPSAQLKARLEYTDEIIATSIITLEEQTRGWLARRHHETNPQKQIELYAQLQLLFDFFANWVILEWNDDAVVIFERLRKSKVRIGTMDLKIASITLANDATLLSRNLRDFQRVPGLRVEDWLT